MINNQTNIEKLINIYNTIKARSTKEDDITTNWQQELDKQDINRNDGDITTMFHCFLSITRENKQVTLESVTKATTISIWDKIKFCFSPKSWLFSFNGIPNPYDDKKKLQQVRIKLSSKTTLPQKRVYKPKSKKSEAKQEVSSAKEQAIEQAIQEGKKIVQSQSNIETSIIMQPSNQQINNPSSRQL